MLISRVSLKPGTKIGKFTLKREFVIWPKLSLRELSKGRIMYTANHDTFGPLHGKSTPREETYGFAYERDKFVEESLLYLKHRYGLGNNLRDEDVALKDIINSYL